MSLTKMAAFKPSGWLDIHAHFQLPTSLEEAQQRISYYHQAKFMVDGPVLWSADEVLRYNDAANIQMQMLSCIPANLEDLKRTNDFGQQVVQDHPTRFGLLAALPTDNPEACLNEITRTSGFAIPPDGYAVTTFRNGCYLGDPRLDVVWQELNTRKAVVHIHPSAASPPSMGRPVPLIEVAFDTTRTVVDMIYNNVFSRFSNIKFVLAHCGGALPVLSGRLHLLGTQTWVPNNQGITREDMTNQLAGLYVDTAATAKTGLEPAFRLCGAEGCIYGSDCGVPCSTAETMEENRKDVIEFEKQQGIPVNTIGSNGWDLFPGARARVRNRSGFQAAF